MSMVDVSYLYYPPVVPYRNAAIGANQGLLIDAADEKAALIFRPPKAGDIRKIYFRTGTVTTGATLDVRVETVTTRNPSGTLWGTNTNVSVVVADGNDDTWFTATLTADATVTATHITDGTAMAVVVVNPSGSPGTLYLSSGGEIGVPGSSTQIVGAYPAHFTTAWQGQHTTLNRIVLMVEYSDSSIVPITGIVPVDAWSSSNISTSTNPDEVAAKFTQRGKARVCGFWLLWGYNPPASAGRIQLYADGNHTPLLVAKYDGVSLGSGNNLTTGWMALFPSTYIVSHGTVLRLSMLPETTSTWPTRYADVPSASYFNAWPGGTDVKYSERNRSSTTDPDTAAWSDTSTRRLMAGVIYDQIDDGYGPTAAYVYNRAKRELIAGLANLEG